MSIYYTKILFVMSIFLVFSQNSKSQYCGYAGGELKVTIKNPHAISKNYSVVLKAVADWAQEDSTGVYVWDSNGFIVPYPHAYYEVKTTKTIQPQKCGCFSFEWIKPSIDSNNPVFGCALYRLSIMEDSLELAFLHIDYRRCSVSGSPDITLQYIYDSSRINIDDVDCDFNRGIPAPGLIIPPNTGPPTCLSIPVTYRNDFHLPGQTINEKNLIVNDSCNDIIVSGTTREYFGTPLISVRPRQQKYNDIYLDSGKIYHFKYWRTKTSDIDFVLSKTITKPTVIYSNFIKSEISNVFVVIDGIEKTGTLSFRNPWYITVDTVNCTYSQNTTFRTLAIPYTGFNFGDFSYGGVFLNQGDPQQLNPPYYSLRASKYLDISGNHKWPGDTLGVGESFFTGWSVAPADSSAFIVTDPDPSHQHGEYDTKAVIFKEAEAEVTANYKAHLITGKASNTSESRSALSPNSQRKVDWVATQDGQPFQQGLYQAVYESAGEVWYISARDSGLTWSKEIRLSSGDGAASHPCLAADSAAAYVTFKAILTAGC